MRNYRISFKAMSLILIMTFLLQLFMPIISIAGNNIEIVMTSDATQIKQGEEIYINLYITGDSIASMSGYLNYDTTIFEEVKKKNWILPEILQDEENGYGGWSVAYNIEHKKIVIEESNGDKFNIPDSGLLVKLKLKALKDSETATIELKTIEVDGSGSNYYYIDSVSCTIPKEQDEEQSNLTINPNGGTWDGSNETRTFTEKVGTTKEIEDPSINPNGNKINFNSNGGIVSQVSTTQTTTFTGWTGANLSDKTYTFGTEDETLTANYEGDEITLPEARKDGQVFLGWYDSKDNYVGTTGDHYAPKYTTPNAVVTLTAKYGDSKYTLEIDPNGGTYLGSTSVQGTDGSTANLATPTKTGFKVTLDNNDGTPTTTIIQEYKFEGWTVTAGDIEGSKYTFTNSNAEAKANYTANAVELPNPTRKGYEFEGWYTEKTGGTKVDNPYIPSSDVTLYAHWTPKKYNVTFDAGENAIVDESEREVQNGDEYGELPIPRKEGHTFLGWYDESGNKVEASDIVDLTEDQKLHAKYEVSRYTVTFKNDDGTIIKTIKVEHGSDAIFTGNPPSKNNVEPGYEAKFIGWNDENDLKNVMGDVIVVAKYEVKPIVYTITYYNTKKADNSLNPKSYTIKDSDITLEDLENQGKYTFMGWYDSNYPDAKKVTSIDTSKLGNIVLYARWYPDELYLSSEKYKVGENDIDNYEVNDIYLDKIEPNTTVKELIANCDTNGIISVINDKNEVLNEDDLVGTNMKILVTRFDEKITLTAVVMGDLDGDGKSTATDLSTLNQTMLDKKTLEGAILKAADLDDNLKLTATDLSTINNGILGNIKLTYDKHQAIITSL